MKDRPPLFLWQKVNKELRIEETGGVCAVIGAADLVYNLRNFREGTKNGASPIRDHGAFSGTSARRQCASHPYCAFIQMGQKLRPDHTSECKEHREPNNEGCNSHR